MGQFDGRLGHARVIVATVIEEELAAAKRILGANHAVRPGFWSPGPGSDQDFVVARVTRSNTPAALSIHMFLEAWRPAVIVLCGIAGGVGRWQSAGTSRKWTGPALGDVVIGHFVHYADYAKNVGNERKMRYFAVDHPSSRLVEVLRDELQASDDWCRAIDVKQPKNRRVGPVVWDGEILATESVAGSPRSEAQRHMLRHFDNAKAVDMESAGVARSVHEYRNDIGYNPRWISVRGVSDKVWAAPEKGPDIWSDDDNASERDKYKRYAAASAAAATKEIIARSNALQHAMSDLGGRLAP